MKTTNEDATGFENADANTGLAVLKQVEGGELKSLPLNRKDQLLDCERVISAGLWTCHEVGQALWTIKEEKLYLEAGYERFEDYCVSRFGIHHTYAYRQIKAAKVIEELSTIVEKPLPKNEHQAGILSRFDSPTRVRVWKKTLELAGNNEVTLKHLRAALHALELDGGCAALKTTRVGKGSGTECYLDHVLKCIELLKRQAKQKEFEKAYDTLERIKLGLENMERHGQQKTEEESN